jgi:hypothetical protein
MMQLMSEPDEAVADLLAKYRQLLVEMDAQRVEHGGKARSWNRLVDGMQTVQLKLRASDAGRAGITALIGDDNPTVRSWSAVNALSWSEEVARAELEREIQTDDGMVGFEAKIALREHDAGRLNTAWVPRAT